MRARLALVAATGLVAVGAACDEDAEPYSDETNGQGAEHDPGEPNEPAQPAGEEPAGLEVELHDANGDPVGAVVFAERDDASLSVDAEVDGLDPGFAGFHIHERGECDPADPEGPFMSAGDHYVPAGADDDHPDHAGDLPPLLVRADGTAHLRVATDRLDLDDLTGDENRAVIVHDDADNLAHIPERYTSEDGDNGGPDPETLDAETLDAGDAGDRVACGVTSAEGGDE